MNTLASPILIILAFAVYGLVHTLLASVTAKDLAYTFWGKAAERYYRLGYTIFAFVTFLPVLALPAWLPDMFWYTISAPWAYVMLAGQGLSLLLLGYSLLQTGMFTFVGLPQAFGLEREEQLNTGGLYRYMRHPLYTFTLTFLWLSPVMSQNLASLNLAVSLYAVAGAFFEERKLLRQFGDAYAEYQQRTPMLIPVPWGDRGK